MKFQRLPLLLMVPVFIISCGTQRRSPEYLEQLRDTTVRNTAKFPELKIQKNDLLSIFVYSDATENKEKVEAPYNLPVTAAAGPASGFLVDANGDIEYPGIGRIHVEGMTKTELATYMKSKLGAIEKNVLTNPSVIIRWLNYKITMLGEVNKEGIVNLPGEKVNILEAIGLAGGITPYGKKESVRIIREVDGVREFGTIDLTSDNLFTSPYFNLVQNDIILVEPTKSKARPEDQVTWQKITAVVGLVTSLVFIYDRIFNNR
jgi:polysaccharide export outer membrane protein